MNYVRAISRAGGVSVGAVDATAMVGEMERLHRTSATVSAALGRTLIAASLMGSLLKHENDSLTLRINGGGPVGSIVAVSDYLGNVRGTCDRKVVDLPLSAATGKLDVAGAVGTRGTISVIRDLGLKEPYIGQVPLTSGEIAEDVTGYYAVSEQIPTVCALGVLVNPDLSIRAAGGYLLQLLPGAGEEEIALLEQNVSRLDPVSSMIDRGMSAREIAERALAGFSPEIIAQRTVAYRCTCSERRTREILMSLGREEILSMMASGEETETVCAFCNRKYRYSPEEIFKML